MTDRRGGPGRWPAALATVLVLSAATACAGMSEDEYAASRRALRGQLLALDGVQKVRVGGERGSALLPGSVTFSVSMRPGASDADVAGVVDAAYADFRSTFGSVGADLGIDRGRDHLELHADDASAEDDSVRAVVGYALDLPEKGERVVVDINTRDEEGHGPLESEVVLHLPPGTTDADVLPRLDALAREPVPSGTGSGVVAADGSGVTGAGGLPTEKNRDLWAGLRATSFAGDHRLALSPLNIAPDEDRWHVSVATRVPPMPRARQHRLVQQLMRRHLLLDEETAGFSYSLTVNGEDTAFFASSQCGTRDVPRWQRSLNAWYAATSERCSS